MIEKLGVFYDEKVQRLIDSFSLCFKVRFTIFSADCEDLIVGSPYCPSAYCELIRDKIHLLPHCLDQNRRMCRRCEDSHEPLIYRCHAGLYEAVMPLEVNQKLIGYAMIGQFREEGNKEGMSKELFAQAEKAGVGEDALREVYLKLPAYNEQSTQNMVSLFSVLINFIVMEEYINAYQPGLAEKISHWIDNHLAEPMELDDAADAIGRSRSTVSHTIKKQFGMSFKQLCTLKRVRRFESLIAASPAMTIAEAAYKVGFGDPLYFSRIYKKLRLVSPAAYIKLIKKNEGTTGI
jgi:AraC-like DNA-binding protein